VDHWGHQARDYANRVRRDAPGATNEQAQQITLIDNKTNDLAG